MLTKIIEEETKECLIINQEEAKDLPDMVEMEVEQDYCGRLFAKGYAPEKPQEVINAERIAELQNFLNGTDWYAVRFAETGVEIPEDIKAARQSARGEISRLRGDNDNAEG